jgi:V-type H+-transporting ATPase subunit E
MDGVYEDFLEGVIAEGFMHVMEPTVTIHCRKSDVENVKTAAAKAAKTYQDLSGIGITFDVLGLLQTNGTPWS